MVNIMTAVPMSNSTEVKLFAIRLAKADRSSIGCPLAALAVAKEATRAECSVDDSADVAEVARAASRLQPHLPLDVLVAAGGRPNHGPEGIC
jgi:hypothetical protein